MNIKIAIEAGADDCGGMSDQRRTLVSFDEAVAAAVEIARPMAGSDRLDLQNATGRILSCNVYAPSSLPRFDHSAMDGFAVRTSDFTGPGPWNFAVAKTLAAGDDATGVLALPASAVEIYTGAPVPTGFDAVIVRENCRRIGEPMFTQYAPRAGENIRRMGEDVAQGSLLVSAGSRVSAHVAALLAASGKSEIEVRPRVRVALITTGSELRRPGDTLEFGQIYDSNRFLARAILSLPWLEFVDLGHVRDDLAATTEALQIASQAYDVVLTSGGMSHGAADHMRAALTACNARLEVLNVAMRPGKPATFGRVGEALFIGLPGNPMAAAVVLGKIGLPAIAATAGLTNRSVEHYPAMVGFNYRKREGRTEFVPVKVVGRNDVGHPIVTMLGRGSSGSLLPMSMADGLAALPAELTDVYEGMFVRYEPFTG